MVINMENSGKIERSAGILMHISSLPSPFGIGTFGKTAYEFVDFVAQARHRYWQVLPLGPTTYGDSPYQSYSAFAGNPYFVDLEMLTDDGILDRNIYEDIDWGSGDYVDYEKVYNNRFTVLHEAYKNNRQKLSESRVKLAAGLPEYKKFDNFNKTNAYWLDDYALFMALKWHFNQKSWQDWDEDIKFRTQKGMQKYKELLADEIGFWKFVQYEFDKQWKKLKEYANENNVDIIGDIPIYMGLDSSDVWADAGEFLLDENLTVFQTIDDVAQGDIRNKIKDLLGAFMFGGENSAKKVKVLSGGERTRLAMIKLLLEPVNLLILDEPTNHLDMKTKDILKQALLDFDGTLIVVSHDRDFLDGLVSKVYEFGNQKVTEHLEGIYEFMQRKKMENLRELERKN